MELMQCCERTVLVMSEGLDRNEIASAMLALDSIAKIVTQRINYSMLRMGVLTEYNRCQFALSVML